MMLSLDPNYSCFPVTSKFTRFNCQIAAVVALRRRQCPGLSLPQQRFPSKNVFSDHGALGMAFCPEWSKKVAVLSFSFFNGDKIASGSNPGSSGSHLFGGRQWTNAILAANLLIYIAQHASGNKLLFWGAKINSLIRQGQLWRLVTSSFLHGNIVHLLVNCYSMNSIGPAVENLCGPKRFLAIYIASAIASSVTSYYFSKAPSVGASGAIFGLVGSFAAFTLRHRNIVKGAEDDINHVARAMGLLTRGIDNWAHLGGLIGGAAISWLIGPAWKLEAVSLDGIRMLRIIDKAPIFSLIRRFHK